MLADVQAVRDLIDAKILEFLAAGVICDQATIDDCRQPILQPLRFAWQRIFCCLDANPWVKLLAAGLI